MTDGGDPTLPDAAEGAEPLDRAEGLRPQQSIVSVFGLYGRGPDGGTAPIPVARLIELLGDLGFDAASVRSSVSRLKKRSVLASVRQGRQAAYTLAPGLHEVFAEGDQRIFRLDRAGPDEPWLLAAFTVPESERHVRHRIRRIFTRRGFGAVTPGLWIAPARTFDETYSRLRRDQLEKYVDFFESKLVGEADLADKIAQWWDLPALAAQYEDFQQQWEPVHRGWTESTGTDRQAFADYVSLITHWRRFPYLDPGLPLACLPDPWPGQRAGELFAALHQQLQQPADRHAAATLHE